MHQTLLFFCLNAKLGQTSLLAEWESDNVITGLGESILLIMFCAILPIHVSLREGNGLSTI